MPNVSPAALQWTGGTIATVPALTGLTPASLRWRGGIVSAGPGTGAGLSVTAPKLDRLRSGIELVDSSGRPTKYFHLWTQTMLEAIEGAFAGLTTQVGDNTSLLAQIQAAQELAQAANDNALATRQAVSLTDSYVSPANVLTATSGGSVTIAAHQRVYGDGTSVSVDGSTLTGFAPGSFVRVFYVDAAREGGAVTYQSTTNSVAQSGDVHVVGGVAIPEAGEADSSGAGVPAPGYVPNPNDFYNRGDYYIP